MSFTSRTAGKAEVRMRNPSFSVSTSTTSRELSGSPTSTKRHSAKSLPHSSNFEQQKILPRILVELEYLEGVLDANKISVYKGQYDRIISESLLEAICARTEDRYNLLKFFLTQGVPIKKGQYSHPIFAAVISRSNIEEEEYLKTIELLLQTGIKADEIIYHKHTNILDIVFLYGSVSAVELVINFYKTEEELLFSSAITPPWFIWSLTGRRKKLRNYLHKKKKLGEEIKLNELHPSAVLLADDLINRATPLLCACIENQAEIVSVLFHYGTRSDALMIFPATVSSSSTSTNLTNSNNSVSNENNNEKSGSESGSENSANTLNISSNATTTTCSTNNNNYNNTTSSSTSNNNNTKDNNNNNNSNNNNNNNNNCDNNNNKLIDGFLNESSSSTNIISIVDSSNSIITSEGRKPISPSNSLINEVKKISPLKETSEKYQLKTMKVLLNSPQVNKKLVLSVFIQTLDRFYKKPIINRVLGIEILKELAIHIHFDEAIDNLENVFSNEQFGICKYMLCILCDKRKTILNSFLQKFEEEERSPKIDKELANAIKASVLLDEISLIQIIGIKRAINIKASDPEYNIWYLASIHNSIPILEALFENEVPYDVIIGRFLLMLIYHNQIGFVKKLLQKLPTINLDSSFPYFDIIKPNKKNHYHFTPLQLACKYNCYDIVEILVDCGASIDYYGDKINDYQYSPLFIAVSSAKLELILYLIENGANINIKPSLKAKNKISIFQNAIRRVNIPVIELLLTKNVNLKSPSALAALLYDFPTKFPRTLCRKYIKKFFSAGCAFHDEVVDYERRVTIALFAGCYSGSRPMIDHLWAVNILRDLNLLIRGIVLACENYQLDIVKYLMNYYSQSKNPGMLNLQNSLQIAIRTEQVEIVDFLLNSNYVLKTIPMIGKLNAIDFSVKKLNYPLFSVLKKYTNEISTSSYKIIVKHQNNSSYCTTPINSNDQKTKISITSQSPPSCFLFFQAMKQINATELCFAVLNFGNENLRNDMIELIQDDRVAINSHNDEGKILSIVCYERQKDKKLSLLKLFLSRDDFNINVNQKCKTNNYNLLFCACLNGDYEIVKLLIKKYNQNNTNNNLESYLHINAKCFYKNKLITPIYAACLSYIFDKNKRAASKVVELLLPFVDPTILNETDSKYYKSKKVLTPGATEIPTLKSSPTSSINDVSSPSKCNIANNNNNNNTHSNLENNNNSSSSPRNTRAHVNNNNNNISLKTSNNEVNGTTSTGSTFCKNSGDSINNLSSSSASNNASIVDDSTICFRNESPLHLACANKSKKLINILSKKYSFTITIDVMTPALYLIEMDEAIYSNGKQDFPLLSKYLSDEDLKSQSALNVDALAIAIYKKSVSLVDYLLNRGLDPNIRGKYAYKKPAGQQVRNSNNNNNNNSNDDDDIYELSEITYPICHAANVGEDIIIDRILTDPRVNIRAVGPGFSVYQEGSPIRTAYKNKKYTCCAKILIHYSQLDINQILEDITDKKYQNINKNEIETIFIILIENLLKILNMHSNQIPERFENSNEKKVQYLYDLAQGQQEFRRLRVIIVGPAAAGKTTIVKRLVGDYWNGTRLQHYDEVYEGYIGNSSNNNNNNNNTTTSNSTASTFSNLSSSSAYKASRSKNKKKRKGVTDGIDVHFWKPKDQNVAISLWDFAGQEIYYTTHQFFLAPNTLYLIVFNATLPLKHGNIVYWLNSIQSRVKGQQVLIIATHVDKISSKRNQKLQELNDEIKTIYHRWMYQFEPGEDVIQIITQEHNGMLIWPIGKKETLEHIENAMIHNAEEKQPIPSKYMLLRSQINKLRINKSPPIIEKDELVNIVKDFGIDIRETDLALELLHEWGEVMYFPNGWHLAKKIILDPRWLSDLFKTVSSFKFCSKEGNYSAVISLSELKQRWRDAKFSPDLDIFLVELLKFFQVMVEAPNENGRYIVPSLLRSSPPEDYWIPLRLLHSRKKQTGNVTPHRFDNQLSSSLLTSYDNRSHDTPSGSSPNALISSTSSLSVFYSTNFSSNFNDLPPPSSSSTSNLPPLSNPSSSSSSLKIKHELYNQHQGAYIIPKYEYYREYHLPFSPHGLISRLLAHFFILGQRGDISIEHFWESGVVLYDQLHQIQILVVLEDDNQTTFGRIVEVVIRGSSTHWRTKMAFFHSLVTGIIFDWYPGIRNRISIFVGKRDIKGCVLHLPYEDCVDKFLLNKNYDNNNNNAAAPGADNNNSKSSKSSSKSSKSSSKQQHHHHHPLRSSSSSTDLNSIIELLPELTQPIIRWEQGEFLNEDLSDSKLQFHREIQIIKKLGGGMFGNVYKAKWNEKLVAVKTLSADSPNRDDIMDFCKEVAVLKALDHPAIVKLLYFFPNPMAIVTELITGGDLEGAIKTHYAQITWNVLIKILLDISRALAYMHALNPPIYHNDIKVANILVIDLQAKDPDIAVKLADVGCARMATSSNTKNDTIDFMSEEQNQFVGLLIDLFDASSKKSTSTSTSTGSTTTDQNPCPAPLQQLLDDAKQDKIAKPYFSNVVKRLEFLLKHSNELQLKDVHNKMEQLHVLQQLEGAMFSEQRDMILEILSSPELHSLGKRGQRLIHDIFMDAIKKEDASFFNALLQTGAWGANTFLDDSHSYLIHSICSLGNEELLKILIEKSVDIESIDPKTHGTALHIAVINNHPHIVRLLLANFANVNALDFNDQTPTLIAVRKAHVECLQHLLRMNVDANSGFSSRANEIKTEKRFCLLKEAIPEDVSNVLPEHRLCVKCLLEHGASRPVTASNDQIQIIMECAVELFQFMCFAEPTMARQTAIGLISLFRTCTTIELQYLQDQLSLVNEDIRNSEKSSRKLVFGKILDKKSGLSIKPEIFEKTVSENSNQTEISFVLKNYTKNELCCLILLPKSSQFVVTCPNVNVTIKSGHSFTVNCEIYLQKYNFSTAVILVEVETTNSIEYHYVVTRIFPVAQNSTSSNSSILPSSLSNPKSKHITAQRVETC